MKGKPVVIGVDGSPESLHVAEIASRIAHESGSECIPVYALPTLWMPDGEMDVSMSPELVDRLKQHVRDVLSQGGMHDEVIARHGKSGVVLKQVASERRAGLVVVGARHHGALSRALGGSTAHHLVRTVGMPVLIVDSRTKTIERILVAVDLFNAGATTLRTAARYAGLLGARLRVVHVVEPAKYPVVIPLSLDQVEYERRCREEFARLIDAELPALPPDDRIVRQGLADEEIAAEAAAWQADLVVIGSHGKTWIDRLLIGSTTERLLNRSPASLLVVPIRRLAGAGRPEEPIGHAATNAPV